MLDMDVINAAMVRSRTNPEAYAAGQADNTKNAKKTELGQEDFLALMVAQLKNQDPFKPLDPSQYVGQLAQFSSVSGLSSMNQQLTNLTSSLRGNQVLDGAGLIGRTVIAPGKQVYLDDVANTDRLLPLRMGWHDRRRRQCQSRRLQDRSRRQGRQRKRFSRDQRRGPGLERRARPVHGWPRADHRSAGRCRHERHRARSVIQPVS